MGYPVKIISIYLGCALFVAILFDVRPVAGQNVDEKVVHPRFQTRTVPGGRIDVDTGVRRAKYRFRDAPRRDARKILEDEATDFGWSTDLSELELIREDRAERSTHLTYRQQFRGIPIEGRFVKLSLNREGQPSMLTSGFSPISVDKDINVVPAQSAALARSVAMAQFAARGGRSTQPELMFTAEETPRLAWKLIVWPEDEPAEWVVFVSADDASVIASFDQSIRSRGSAEGDIHGRSFSSPVSVARNDVSTSGTDTYRTSGAPVGLDSRLSRRRISGTGFIFDPDPLTTAGMPYGAPFADSDDSSVPELDAERKLVNLRDISVNGNGKYVLEGPFIKIVGVNQVGNTTYSPPEALTPDGFRFSRSHDGFEAVNAYYHVDQSQRYVQTLGITNRRNESFRVNPLGLTGDDSFYFPSGEIIVFGSGGVDDAEDATIIVHEYAHALLDAVAPGILGTLEGKAFHEGWSDYWAASYARFLTESGAVARTDWDRLFRWDTGDGAIWPGRILNDFGHYPEDVCSARSQSGSCDIHADGVFWATTMMEVYTELGRETTDILNLRSHQYLSAPVTFSEAAEAILQADLDYFGGEHSNVLFRILGDRGLIDVQSIGPAIIHTPIVWAENVGGVQPISMNVIPVSDPVSEVNVFYRFSNGTWNVAVMQLTSENYYQGEINLPATPGDVSYYVEAVDGGERVTTLPKTAPGSVIVFTVGPDITPPVIAHESMADVAFVSWPPTVAAVVTDNFGVSEVVVSYRIDASTGEELDAGEFSLSQDGNEWRGKFPVDPETLELGAEVYYRITATDISQSALSTVLPGSGDFVFKVVSNGILALHDFDGFSSTAIFSGSFERGVPEFGLRTAHSQFGVAGIALQAAYPSETSYSFLELPPVNLTGVQDARLIFWHWYDLEHDGSADPASTDGVLWDGGNVKISTDGGQNWELLQPDGGYRGTVETSPGNPLSGEPAFGGYSYGWRQEIIPLPNAADMRVRFDFGTDSDNSADAKWFAGWFIDDVQIGTRLPVDSGIPVALQLPDSPRSISITESMPQVEVLLSDDNGIADVFADYVFTDGSGTTSGTLRFEMDPGQISVYQGSFDFITAPSPSDHLSYRIRAIDHSGQESIFSDGVGEPFEINYWIIDQDDVLQTAAVSGIWKVSGTGWSARNDPDQSEDKYPLSTINLVPLDIPANGTGNDLVIRHAFRIFDSVGGNVKISEDGGRSWQLLNPEGGYGATLKLPDDHPMSGEMGFAGVEDTPLMSTFSLQAYTGKQVRVRIDLAITRKEFFDTEYWVIESANYIRTTGDEAFVIERELSLFPNYPNPFSGSTRVGLTLEESGDASLELYDITGRLVRTVFSRYFEAGTYEETVFADNLAAGMYFLRLRSGGAAVQRPIVIIR